MRVCLQTWVCLYWKRRAAMSCDLSGRERTKAAPSHVSRPLLRLPFLVILHSDFDPEPCLLSQLGLQAGLSLSLSPS